MPSVAFRSGLRAKALRFVTVAALLGACAASAADQLAAQLDSQADCVATPEEYLQAFEARAPRCVSSELYGRVSMGPTEADVRGEDTTAPLAYFWSGPDVLAKYLRVGVPQELGVSTAANASGLYTPANGLASLLQIGFTLESIDVTQVYLLSVYPKAALEASAAALEDRLPYGGGVGLLSPTWEAVRDYYAFVFEVQGFNVSDVAVELLRSASFAELTGCPPSCAYVPAGFPSADAPTPLVTRDPTSAGGCPEVEEGGKRLPPALPTGLAAGSELCNADWLEARAQLAPLINSTCSPESNLALGEGMAALLATAAGDARRQALLFRAFIMAGCAGDFNSLFAGSGMTFTGEGGMLAPLGTEFITSPYLPPADGVGAQVAFCITGGKPNAQGRCELPRADSD